MILILIMILVLIYLATNSGFPVLKDEATLDLPQVLHLYRKSNFLTGLFPPGNGLGYPL